jgi:hypothetical protein
VIAVHVNGAAIEARPELSLGSIWAKVIAIAEASATTIVIKAR